MLTHKINLKMGVSGWQLVLIASIILGILILVLGWLFMDKITGFSNTFFVKLGEELKSKICDALGIFGQTIGIFWGC